MELDLSKLSSVRKFASEFLLKYGGASNPAGLSILVNNAGIFNPYGVRKVTEDGFEETFGVNHLAHFLLTNLLLPEIEKAGSTTSNPGRIVTLSSLAHASGQLNFDDLMFHKTPFVDFRLFSKFYANSKLANNLFNLELAKRLRAKKVNVNSYALCPGTVVTNILTEFRNEMPRDLYWLVFHVVGLLFITLSGKTAKEVSGHFCFSATELTLRSKKLRRKKFERLTGSVCLCTTKSTYLEKCVLIF